MSQSNVKLMAGPALYLAAGQYPRLTQVVKEAVQNGLDAGATVIQIVIDRKKRDITVRDNGTGATPEKFEKALQHVCQTMKNRDKLGQFGIGLIAALGKCQAFTVTTRMSTNRMARRWTFDSEAIKQMEDVKVPYADAPPDVLHGKSGESHGVKMWSFELRIKRYSSDRQVGKLDIGELRQEILGNFAVVMRERKAAVWIDEIDEAGTRRPSVQVRASEFAGKALAEEKRHTGYGRTLIRLYVVPRREKRKGEVQVGVMDNPFRVPWKTCSKQFEALNFIDADVIAALNSGIFEGEILHSNIVLEPNRKTFVENDALLDLCAQIDDWLATTGRAYLDEARDSRAAERWQELGRRSLENLKGFFEENADYLEFLKGGSIGRVTDDHSKRPRAQVVGTEEVASIAAAGQSTTSGSGGHANGVPQKDLPGHVPYTVTGPHGRQRTMVRGDSQGLSFSHVEMDSDDLYRFERKTGTLFFNITHPQWVECDNDRDLMRFQEFIAILAITEALMPEPEQPHLQHFLKKVVGPTVYLLRESPAFTFGFGRKKKA